MNNLQQKALNRIEAFYGARVERRDDATTVDVTSEPITGTRAYTVFVRSESQNLFGTFSGVFVIGPRGKITVYCADSGIDNETAHVAKMIKNAAAIAAL